MLVFAIQTGSTALKLEIDRESQHLQISTSSSTILLQEINEAKISGPLLVAGSFKGPSYTLAYQGNFDARCGSDFARAYLQSMQYPQATPKLQVSGFEIPEPTGTLTSQPILLPPGQLRSLFRAYENYLKGYIVPQPALYELAFQTGRVQVTLPWSTLESIFTNAYNAMEGGVSESFIGAVTLTYVNVPWDLGNEDFADGSTTGVYD
jgi:hypothetical protein